MALSAKQDEELVEVEEVSSAVQAISGSTVLLQSRVVARIHASGPHRRSGRKTATRTLRNDHYLPNAVTSPRNKAVWNIWNIVRPGIYHIFHYILKLGEIFVHCIRTPLAYVMVMVILWQGTGVLIGHASDVFLQALRPTCKILPGVVSSLLQCNPPSSPSSLAIVSVSQRRAKWADYSALTDIQIGLFEQLLKGSAGGLSLSLEIKKAEMATSDLITQVKLSNLNSRENLAISLSEFVQDAKKTGRSLQKFASKVGGAVDNVMSVNDYSLKAIRTAREEELSWKWIPRSLTPSKESKKQMEMVIMHTFGDAMSVLASNMERLIVEAEISLHNLDNLEESLRTIHAIIVHEDSFILSAKTDLLWDLWTVMGGNRKILKNFDNHLSLLRGIAHFRREALQHVVAALQTLEAMSNDIEDLRERIAAPNLIGEAVPPEVHITSIQRSLDRLSRGRINAKKLEDDTSKLAIQQNLY